MSASRWIVFSRSPNGRGGSECDGRYAAHWDCAATHGKADAEGSPAKGYATAPWKWGEPRPCDECGLDLDEPHNGLEPDARGLPIGYVGVLGRPSICIACGHAEAYGGTAGGCPCTAEDKARAVRALADAAAGRVIL